MLISLAKATSILDVEVLQLKKKSSLSTFNIILPQESGFYVVLGEVGVCVLVVYELYKRSTKQSQGTKKQRKIKGKRN